jgi:hypothetical protein
MNDEPVNLVFRMREPAAAAVRQKKHGAAPGRIRRLHPGLSPRRVGVRIK